MRALLPIGIVAFIAAVAPAACTASVSVAPFPTTGTVAFVPPSGFAETTCSGTDYIAVDLDSCPGSGCGTEAYALCDDGAYADCSCDIPAGWTEVDYSGPGSFGSDAGVGSGDDGGGEDGGADAGGEDGGADSGSEDGGAGSDGAADDGGSGDDGGTGDDGGGD